MALAAAVIVAALAAGTSGCAAASALKYREAVVQFAPDATLAQRAAARAACSHIPNATPEPMPTSGKASQLLNNVRYRIDDANDRDLAALYRCLTEQPKVRGVDIPDTSG